MKIQEYFVLIWQMLIGHLRIFVGVILALVVLVWIISSGSSDDVDIVLTPHSMAIKHLPMFVAGPGETDVFFNIVVAVLITVVMLVGVFYFALHALPEKMAHNSRQLQFVAILSLIALFTHNNYFWIAALLLAAIKLPDFSTPLNSIATSLSAKYKKEI